MILVVLILMFISPVISVMAVLLRSAEQRQAVSWPQVIGEVTAVRILTSGKQHFPELDVAYSVADQAFTARHSPISQTGQAKGNKAWARQLSLNYKPGTAVPVFYNPSRPQKSTLNPKTAQANDPRWQLTSGVTIFLAVVMHILGARGLLTNYLNLPGNNLLLTIAITTVVTLLLGAALALLIQEARRPTS